MGATQMQKARRFLWILGRKGDIIKWDDFILAMQKHISMDKFKVQKPYYDLMIKFELIKKNGNDIEINV
jgi:hypothetical protein